MNTTTNDKTETESPIDPWDVPTNPWEYVLDDYDMD